MPLGASMRAVLLIIELYVIIVVVDVALAWIQTTPAPMPRRLTHALTEPPQALLRRVLKPAWTDGWDLSPLVIVVLLGALRVWLIQP